MRDLYIRGLSIEWGEISRGSYLRDIDAISSINRIEFEKPVTFLVGENGTGKSTLLEAIAIASGFNPEGGTWNYNFSTRDTHSELHEAIRLVRGARQPGHGYFLRAESFYNVATKEEEYANFAHPSQHYHEQSHGESFLAVAQRQFRARGIYILDEPEAALSPQRQLTLLMEIMDCVRDGSQFIIVTHSPILLGMPDADILSLDGGKIHRIEYEETESYQITKMFIEDRERILNQLYIED